MRKIIVYISSVLCCTLSMAYLKPESSSSNDTVTNVLSEILPDSVCSMIKNRPVIFYSYGHYGFSWSLITKIDTVISAFSGRVSYLGNISLTEPSDFNQFDSAAFFTANKAILSWGFDSVWTESLNMRAIHSEHPMSVRGNLSIFSSDENRVFDSGDAITFSGLDSINFNYKYHRLCLIMRWLAEPAIRQYVPNDAMF